MRPRRVDNGCGDGTDACLLEQGGRRAGFEELGGTDVVVLELGIKHVDALAEPESLGPCSANGKGLIADAPVGDLGDLGIGEGPARVDAEINGAQEAVRALTFKVRLMVICSRAETRTRNAARMPSSCRGLRSWDCSSTRTDAAIAAASNGSDFPAPRRADA